MLWTLPVVALPVALAAAATVPVGTHHIPLTRRTIHKRSEFADLDRIASAADSLRYKYGFKQGPQRKRQSVANIPVVNQGGDTSYLATVNVGTPPQSFAVVLDTGSSDLWFATDQCQNCPPGTPEFQTGRSSSLQTAASTVPLSYGSGQAEGILARDTVSLGPYSITNQIFVAVTSISDGLIDGILAGIMGLGFQTLSVSGATPFWEALATNNQLASPELSFFFTRFLDTATTATETDPGGVFTLGGTNATYFTGDVEFNNFPSGLVPSFWLQTVSGLTVNGNAVSIGASSQNIAAIDTGTTLLGGPTAAVQNFWSQVQGAQPLSGQQAGFFAFPCNTDVTATLSFGGKAWPINPADMNLGQIARGFCMGGLFDVTQGAAVSSGSPAWIVGDTFLKNVYTVFRAGSTPAVGFAELSAAAGGTSGTPTSPSGSARVTNQPGLPTGPASGSGTSNPFSSSGSGSGAAHTRASLAGLATALGVALGAVCALVR